MIVGLAGPSHAGKTTLAQWIRKEFPEWEIIEEPVEDVLKEMGCDLQDVREDEHKFRYFQWKVMERHLEALRDAEGGNFVVDRTIYDVLLYVTFYGTPTLIWEFMEEWYEQFVSPPYDLVIFCRPVPYAGQLGLRTTEDITWRDAHFRMLKSWLKDVRHEEFGTWSINERLKRFEEILEEFQ